MTLLLTILSVSFFSSFSYASGTCSEFLARDKQHSNSIRIVYDFFKIPKDVPAARMTGTLSNPPADASIKGSEVVVQSTQNGVLAVSIRTANFNPEYIGSDGLIIPKSDFAVEIFISQDTAVDISNNTLALISADGKQLSVQRTQLSGRDKGPAMFLVRIFDAEGTSLSAYVISSF